MKNIPSDVRVCLMEANRCFVIGAYNATVVLSWMALEYHLRLHLSPNDRETCGQSLVDLLNRNGERGLLTHDQVQKLHQLRKIRNTVIHSSYLHMNPLGVSKEHIALATQHIDSSALALYQTVDMVLHAYYSTHQH